MKAVFIREHGGPEKLLYEDLPDPVAGPGEVLVRTEAVALNHLDLWIRGGIPGIRVKFPHILGADIAGVVAALGAGVTGVAVGDEVVVSPGVSCMRCVHCLSGRDNFCRDYHLLGEHVSGGCCELLAVPAANIVARPANLSAVEAAAYPVTYLTAWQMLAKRANVRPGEFVVILGVGAGVGIAGLQIAKLLGAHVVATSTSDDKLARARSLGADATINTDKQDLADAVRAMTGKRGADVIFDHIGKSLWSKAILATSRGGRLVTCGATSGFDAETDLRHVFFRQISILGSTMGSKGDLLDVTAHLAAGRLKPVIDRVLPISQAREAHRLLADRAQFGKIVLDTLTP
jgi:NADPH:quinone reductase-like Zn-dependent oxidoreductase